MSRGKKPPGTMEENTPMLPEDLVFAEILSKLPAKSLIRFKCVSKSWLSRISSDSLFIASHLTHHSNTKSFIVLGMYKEDQGKDASWFIRHRASLIAVQNSRATEIITWNIKPLKISNLIGSCNGLVCVERLSPDNSFPRIALWNPATRQHRYVTEPEEPSGSLLGFGFDDQSKDYKIVKVFVNGEWLRAEVFAKRSGGWRAGGGGISGLTGFPVNSAVSAGGALHWLAYKSGSEGGEIGGGLSSVILSFGLSNEVLRLKDAPGAGMVGRSLELCQWRESLAALVWGPTEESWLWTASMSGDGNDELIWSRMVRVSPAVRVGSFRGVWSDQFVVLRECRRGLGLSLHEAGLDGQVRKVKGFGQCVFLSKAHDYIESLLSVF